MVTTKFTQEMVGQNWAQLCGPQGQAVSQESLLSPCGLAQVCLLL